MGLSLSLSIKIGTHTQLHTQTYKHMHTDTHLNNSFIPSTALSLWNDIIFTSNNTNLQTPCPEAKGQTGQSTIKYRKPTQRRPLWKSLHSTSLCLCISSSSTNNRSKCLTSIYFSCSSFIHSGCRLRDIPIALRLPHHSTKQLFWGEIMKKWRAIKKKKQKKKTWLGEALLWGLISAKGERGTLQRPNKSDES